MGINLRLPTIFLLATLGLSACGGAAAPTPVRPSVLNVALDADPLHMNPLLARDPASRLVTEPMFANLYQSDASLNVVPDLAVALPTVSDDLKTWTVSLRTGLLWSDREALNADDLIYTFSLMLNPDLAGQLGGNFGPLKTIDQVVRKSDQTVEFDLGAPFAPFLSALVLPILPKHVLGQVAPAAVLTDPYDKAPGISSGPYRFVRYTPGTSIELEPNPHYHLGRPHYDRMVFHITPATQAADGLANGEISWNPDVPVEALDQLRGLRSVTTYEYPGLNYYDLRFNTRQGHLFDRRETRQALAQAIDKAALVREASGGHATAVDQDIPAASWAHFPSLTPYVKDLDQAHALMASAGWSMGGDGIAVRNVTPPAPPVSRYRRYQPPPQPVQQRFSGKLRVRTGRDERTKLCALISDQVRAIGMDLQCEAVDTATFYQPLQAGTFDVALAGFQVGLDPDNFATLDPSQEPPDNAAGQNYTGFQSDQLHHLIDAGRTTLLPDLYRSQVLRQGIYAEIEQLLHDQLPTLFLYSDNTIQTFDQRVLNTGTVRTDYFVSGGRNSTVFYNWTPKPPVLPRS